MKKAKYHFYLESRSNSNNEKLIFFCLNYGYKEYNPKTKSEKYIPLKLSTKWTILPEFWNGRPYYRANTAYVRQYGRDLNGILEDIEEAAITQLSLYRNEHNTDPLPETLKNKILGSLDRATKKDNNTYLTEYLQALIEKRTKLPIGSSGYWSKSTAKGYTNLLNLIKKYELTRNSNIILNSMDEHIYWDFFETINDIRKKEFGKYYIRTTIAKECKNLRAILNCALDDNIPIGFNFNRKGLKIHPPKPMYETYLSISDLSKIIKSNVSHSAELQRGKDYIILSSFTGLRIGDMKHLHTITPSTIQAESKSYPVFTTKIRKSHENHEELIATLPILQPIQSILNENNNKFPRFTSEPNIRKCIGKLLKYLKFENEITVSYDYYLSTEVIKKNEKLNKVFSPHDCRRTYITNLKQLGIHNETIEPITHPKLNYKSILDSYDKSNLEDKAIKLIDSLNSANSKLFTV